MQPTPYTPTTDFSQQEAINASGRSTVNTAALDAEFANVEVTLDALCTNLELIQRDDGRLGDMAVEVHTLSPDVLNLLGGFNLRGLWAAETAYAVNDIASDGPYTYVCTVTHTSGGSFDATKWIQFGFTSGADAAQAAAAAQVSATNAEASELAAAASASTASTAASTATTQANNASTSAGTATTQANNASTSATNAANSAAAAAASAGSISFPITVANGGTGVTSHTSGGLLVGNGAGNLGIATPAQIVAAIGSTAVANATSATSAANGVPAGAIIDFAGTTAPAGYLECPTVATNISRTTYAALFAAIGTTWGGGDGSATFGMPYFPTGYAAVQGTPGTTTVGEVISHTHGYSSGNTGVGGYVQASSALVGSGNVNSTGGAANKAAGAFIKKCVKT